MSCAFLYTAKVLSCSNNDTIQTPYSTRNSRSFSARDRLDMTNDRMSLCVIVCLCMCVCGIIQLSPTGLCGNWTPLAFDATSDNKSEPKGACAACLACLCAGIARAQSLAVFSTAHLSGPGTAALQPPPPLPPVVVMQAPRYRILCPPASASQRDTVNAKACMRVRCSRFSSYSNCCAVRHNATCDASPSTRREIISGRAQTPSRAWVSLKERCGGCCGSRPAALNVRTSAHIFVSIMHRCVGHAKK